MASRLIIAAESNDVSSLKRLACGADVNSRDVDGSTALHVACEEGHVAVLIALLDGGADIHACSHYDDTALHTSVHRGQVATTVLLLAKGRAFWSGTSLARRRATVRSRASSGGAGGSRRAGVPRVLVNCDVSNRRPCSCRAAHASSSVCWLLRGAGEQVVRALVFLERQLQLIFPRTTE